jgi:hypothetical protein
MLITSPTSLFLSTLLLSTTTAAPARTHCRCSVVSNPSPAQQTPSAASQTPLAADVCASLGPELENFQNTNPELYSSYFPPSTQNPDESGKEQSIATTVWLDFASRNALKERQDRNTEPRPTSRPFERVVCYSESEPFTTFRSSLATLWATQIVIALAILVCLAEGAHLGMQWYAASSRTPHSHHIPEKRSGLLRLAGTEKLLLALPTIDVEASPRSPGMEKKMRAYEASPAQTPGAKREFNAYEDDSDDEMHRPVM